MTKLKPGMHNGEIITLVRLDYATESEDPSRVFRSMAKIIDSIYELERDLAASISAQIHPVQVLQKVEAGSIKAWLRTIFKQVDDDALKSLDWRPVVGQYLVVAKKRVLHWLGDRDHVGDPKELEPLEQGLLNLAKKTDALRIPSYYPIARKRLLADLKSISESTQELLPEDQLEVMSDPESIPVNKGFHISSEDIELLLTASVQRSTKTLALPVKKPDYLGTSMWELKHEGHTVEAKMFDKPWLRRFQSREVDVRPGDAIRANVEVIVRRAADQSVVSVRFNVNKVLEVIRGDYSSQLNLLDDG